MASEEPKGVHVYMSSEGADPETVQAVQDGIQKVLDKFRDAQGIVYVSIENLHIHTGSKHHGPPRHWRDRSRSRRKSRSRSRSRSHSGHRKGKHGKHHSKGRHGHGHQGYGRYHYWCHSSQRTETEDTSAAEETTSGVEASQAPPCCCHDIDKRFKKGKRHGRSRSRSRSKSRGDKDKRCKRDKKWKKDKCCNQKGTDAQPSETIDLTSQNQSGEKDLQEQFDSMNVKSP